MNPTNLDIPRRSAVRSIAPLRRAGLVLAAALALGALRGTPAAAAPPGFAFLEIPAGARASALGGAYASLAEGADATLWNPASLGAMKRVEVSANHAELDQKLHYDAVAIGGHAWGGGFGLSMRALYSEALEGRDELGNLTGSFGAHDLEFALAYGHPVGGGVALGGSAQLVRERLAEVSAMTEAFGFGATWDLPKMEGVRASLGVHNLGAPAHYDFDGIAGDDVGLPMAIHGGLSMRRSAGHSLQLRGALEGRFTRGRPGLGMVGGEIQNLGGAALRAGWRLNDTSSSFSLGAGFQTQRVHFDYAFVPLDLNLGESHRFSVSTQF